MHELRDMIYQRKSCRGFSDKNLPEDTLLNIQQFCSSVRALDATIAVSMQIVSKEQVRFYFPWKAPHLIALYSEKKEGYLENAGFMLQQVDLYLQSLGLGACWLGLGRLRQRCQVDENLEFVILLAFGENMERKPRREAKDYRRKTMAQISDREDPRLECARVAPSSTNSQPWYFTHEQDTIHVWRCLTGEHRHKGFGVMNRIDMGIALAHLYLENPDSFRFCRTHSADGPEGYSYVGTVSL